MPRISLTRLILFVLLLTPTNGLSPTYLPCQVQKGSSVSPLLGCPPGTLFVSANDARANFSSIQAAVDSLYAQGVPATILLGAGDYHETVNVTRTASLTLLGQLPANTSLTPTNASALSNLVRISNDSFVHTGQDDASSAVLVVSPNAAGALIGSGPTGAPLQPHFGNVDFRTYNVDFANLAANYAISQALVTDVSYANASFYGCSFASYQDTWYTGRNGSTYVVDSIVYGQTDYLFGFGTAWFERVVLANRACGGGLVAWKGTNLTDAPGNPYGAYIANSAIIRSPDANATTVTVGECYLGRPWNDLATTVYLNVSMDASINPAGFKPFSSGGVIANTTFYAEYNSSGVGGDTSKRVAADRVLTAAEARGFTVEAVFGGKPAWIDHEWI
ncbi:carbohydrate esterase family 8 protein [Punctularia strigosozonata HHB-11173 SS5]|uniref:carbohydrate esterase family 8 protein n=1 Tax=Punctularia strigosozonata (strain HHB-11173) TaxID=741275 RepID=UPI00044167AD|nr:carbohydrate esterase family 8 protein [Punctularia strigosozonata HHB-11173 SS5]EIN10136.1 carbohydrate esterase family 8 protein [Punctularia strigosozonata HHB-11173 SS5]